mmetsp:Transcript_2417/g.3356  ORF Transcript_2417/g.3356 Transcript_2417/m.3356 type:complete len:402 (-) Transcript_2417:3753-4958(-)
MKIHLLWIHWYVVGVRAFGSAVRNSVPFQSSFDFDRVMLRQHMVPVNGDEEVGSEEEGGAKVNCLQEDNDGEKVMLEEAHRLAMEEDEEWYKSFIMLSKNDFKSEGGDVIVPMKEISDVSGGEEMQENDVNNEDGISENDFDERSLLNNGSNQRKELDPFMSLSTNEMKERLEDLGYCNEDFDKLDDDVINLIIEDSIKRPTNIPLQWMKSERNFTRTFDDLEEKDEITKFEEYSETDEDIEEIEEFIMNSSPNLPKRRKKRRFNKDMDMDDRNVIGERRRSRATADKVRRRQPIMSKTGKTIDEIQPEGSFWPSLPNFKQFLRQESELRLMILGPDFAETLRNEAKWRLNLYEKWLILLEDGYGEDETFNQQQRYARVRRENRRRRDVIEGRHRRKRNER